MQRASVSRTSVVLHNTSEQHTAGTSRATPVAVWQDMHVRRKTEQRLSQAHLAFTAKRVQVRNML